MKRNILVVDDDALIRDSLKRYLTEHDLLVHCVPDGDSMTSLLKKHEFDLVVLDLMLNGEDGLALARRIRENSDLPIIMLTGKIDEVDRIIGLELGADDYVQKPYNPRELLARIRAVLRRTRKTRMSELPETSSVTLARFAEWKLDAATRRLASAQDGPVDLTTGEFELLLAFVQHPQRVLSREQLLEYTHGHASFPFDRSVDVQVMRLRRKIEQNPDDPTLIITMRGVGYSFTPNVEWH